MKEKNQLLAMLLILFLLGNLYCEEITYSGFVTGDLITAAGMNDQFLNIYNLINGNLDSENIASDADLLSNVSGGSMFVVADNHIQVGTGQFSIDTWMDNGIGGQLSIFNNSPTYPETTLFMGRSYHNRGFRFRTKLDDAGHNPDLFIESKSYDEDFSTKMLLRHNGSVGIGTITPGSLLHLANNGEARLQLENSDSDITIGLSAKSTDEGPYIGTWSSDPFSIATNNEYRVTVTAGGDVGIGTSNPGSELHILQEGESRLHLENTESDIKVGLAAKSTDEGSYIGTWTNDPFSIATYNQYRLTIATDGQVGIGKAPNPAYTLDVNGDINCSGDFYNSGTAVADFVFQDHYSIPSIEEHGESMWTNKHLPNVSGKNDLGTEPYSMSERREQILSELEIAHIYIEQLNETIMNLEARIIDLESSLYMVQKE
ncbi:MAG: hypothetical protein JEY99_15460 [Spirochaetales bacterium]|nr:hypothetical protein [Spirochaetales bacterium]